MITQLWETFLSNLWSATGQDLHSTWNIYILDSLSKYGLGIPIGVLGFPHLKEVLENGVSILQSWIETIVNNISLSINKLKSIILFLIGYVWYDELKPVGKDKQQTWIVTRDKPTDNTFHFKSVYWGEYFLTADEGKWVYHHWYEKSTKWLLTVAK